MLYPLPEQTRDRKSSTRQATETLASLASAIRDRILTIEQLNRKQDLSHCKKYLTLFFTEKENVDKGLQQLYPDGGIPSTVCNLSANEVLQEVFGKRLTEEIYSFYSLENRGMISISEFHALIIGALANITLPDLQYIYESKNFVFKQRLSFIQKPFADLVDSELCVLLENIRKVNTDGIKPTKKNEIQINKDLKFLSACKLAEDYSRNLGENDRLKKIRKFSWIEYETKEIAPIMFKYSKAKTAKGVLFPSFHHVQEGREYKTYPRCLSLQPLSLSSEFYGMVITPVKNVSGKLFIRVILGDLYKIPDQAVVSELIQSTRSVREKLHEGVIVQICANGSSTITGGSGLANLISQVLDSSKRDLPNCFDRIEMFFFNLVEVSDYTVNAIQEASSGYNIYSSIRYFLPEGYHKEPNKTYLGSADTKKNILYRWYTSLFVFECDKDKEPRFFAIRKDADPKNQILLNNLLTNYMEDCEIEFGDPQAKDVKSSKVLSWSELNKELITPPLSWGERVSNTIGWRTPS